MEFVFAIIAAPIIISAINLITKECKQDRYRKKCKNDKGSIIEPFSVAEYFKRKEKLNIELLEEQKAAKHTIVLWWGLDGLRMNEDGSTEWIKKKSVNQNVFYQHQTYQYIRYSGYGYPGRDVTGRLIRD